MNSWGVLEADSIDLNLLKRRTLIIVEGLMVRRNLFRKILPILVIIFGILFLLQYDTVRARAFSLGMKCHELLNGQE